MWFEPGELSKTKTNRLANSANPANYEPEHTNIAPPISKLAELAAPLDSEIIIDCYTPNGQLIKVETNNALHAEFLQRMNPINSSVTIPTNQNDVEYF